MTQWGRNMWLSELFYKVVFDGSVTSESLSPCHMAFPQVADGGTVSNMEGGCKYFELAVAASRQGLVLQLGSWARCYQILTMKTYLITKNSYSKPRTWTDTLVRPKQ